MTLGAHGVDDLGHRRVDVDRGLAFERQEGLKFRLKPGV
ncbi:MAG: Uncharacterised protein [Rhodospirillaceae bacterium]|nr:MAG: Uncharacterised protein [Rhodospirillaceae bacterium]